MSAEPEERTLAHAHVLDRSNTTAQESAVHAVMRVDQLTRVPAKQASMRIDENRFVLEQVKLRTV